MTNTYKHTCKYCYANFKLTKNFKKHRCEQMKRHEMLDTKTGKKAFMLYKDWLRLKHRIPPSKETFLNSRYYMSFIKFVKFTRKMAIPSVSDYIKLMVNLSMEPHFWIKLDVYQHYIDKFDKMYTATQQASISVDTFLQLSKIFECDIDDVFKELTADDVIKLIQAKKLSPWLLLLSDKFLSFLQNKATSEQQILIQTIINPTKWKHLFDSKKQDVKQMRKIVKELGI